MRFQFSLIAPKLKRNLRSYLFQVSLATVALLVILWLEDSLARVMIVAAIGSTTCILFITPNSNAGSPRHVLGGHFIGLVVGGLASLLTFSGPGEHFLFALQASVAVGVAMFLMAATDTEHGPAASSALGVVANDFTWGLAFFLTTSIVGLVVIQRLLRRWLHDLE